jgi:MFS family permease
LTISTSTSAANISKLAFRFVLIIGITNLFADMTYEGARSITGPFLGSLGASATMVGFLVGFGELIGYALRSVSGYLADRSHKYWLFVFLGYAVNMLAVPALALAGSWPAAAAFIILERTGRAIRRPAVEAMISHAGKSIGRGWVFGLNEALDQTGATVGPIIVALVLYLHGSYQRGFAVLLISALLCLGVLAFARVQYPRPDELEARSAEPLRVKGFSKTYWIYFFAGALIAAGFADFALIAFHFQKGGIVPQSLIPILYAVAMGTGALSALIFGRLLDKAGMPMLLLPFFLSALFAPFVFLGELPLAIVGMILWGIGIGAQDSLLKAVLANIVPVEKRSTAFGVFDTGFGVAWFVGSAAMGWLYDRSVPALIVFSVFLQLAAVPVLFLAERAATKHKIS